MRRRFRQGAAGFVSGAVIAAVITGCGEDGSADSEPVDSSTPVVTTSTSPTSTSARASAARVRQLVLTAEQVPTGYTVTPVPPSQVQQIMDNLTDALAGATITPATCGNLQKLPDTDPDELGLLVAIRGQGEGLAEALVAQPTDVRESRRQAGECADFRISFTGGVAAGRQAAATTEVLAPVATDAPVADVLAMRQRVTVGGAVSITSLVGIASVKGYTVSVNANGTRPDESAFRSFFAAAVNKVMAQG
ncbi:MAG: hypothetical protein QM662_05500 [Gordonia sp. (in: high G+C Gram-positive bacteria)]